MASLNTGAVSNAFPYALQPQPPSHPKTTGGKRGPSTPITIPSWARGSVEDEDEDSDVSITDHSPPVCHGRLAGLDYSPNSTFLHSNSASTTLIGAPSIRVTNHQVSSLSPRGHSKKMVQGGMSSPRTLANNNSTVTLNLNHHKEFSTLSSSPPAASLATSNTMPTLINTNNNINKSNISDGNNISCNRSFLSQSSVLPTPVATSLACTNSANSIGLKTSHPPAPWVSTTNSNAGTHTSVSPNKDSILSQSSLSKAPKLVDNHLHTREVAPTFPSKFQKVTTTESSHVLPICGTETTIHQTHSTSNIVKSSSNVSTNLVVGIPETYLGSTVNKTDVTGPSCTSLLSPSDVNTGSPGEGGIRASSPTSSSSNSCFAYELDHDYENVASPCSSTASGPTYIRQPGFRHHAHKVTAPSSGSNNSSSTPTTAIFFSASHSPTRNAADGGSGFRFKQKKKCSATLVTIREGFKKREATPPKLKPKREPLPMKLRALPQSFWQQPNVAHQVSPASLFPILPPLPNKDSDETLMEVRPDTPPEDKEATWKQQQPERKLTVANTDLLFKLFEVVADDKKSSGPKTRQQKPPRKPMPKSNTKGLFLGNDPYMVDAVTDKIFPQLTLEIGSTRTQTCGGNSSLQLISLKEGDRTVQLPSLSMEQNYPQMLSELVMHI